MTQTIKHTLHEATHRLQQAGSESPRLDARVLLKHVTGWTDEEILAHPKRQLSLEQHAAYESVVARREKNEPVAYITGIKEFWGLDFQVNPATLTPRPDSEVLVSAVLATFSGTEEIPQTLLDIGTGSGCLLIALLNEWPDAIGIGVDIQPGAARQAKVNAESIGVGSRCFCLVASWTEAIAGRFDCVISNPPYIKESDLDNLSADVKCWEPRKALVAGADGLDAYRALAGVVKKVIAENGCFFLEMGQGQSKEIKRIMQDEGWQHIKTYHDLAGIARCQQYRL